MYVPATCKAMKNSSGNGSGSTCRLHVVYPGCFCSVSTNPKGRPSTGMDIIQHGGFNDWAETNSVIVIYLQHATIACWEGAGRTLPSEPTYDLYDTRQGRQMNVVNRMVDGVGKEYAIPPTGPLILQEDGR